MPSPAFLTPMTTTGDEDVGNVTSALESHQQMLSDDAMESLNLYFNIFLCGIMALFGALTNFVNMMVFSRLGLKDSNSVCLLALAVTDFLLCSSITLTRAFPIWSVFFPTENLDPITILFTFGWVSDSLFLCSGWIVTFLSLERCICVLLPFKVKDIFTRNRAIIAMFVIHVITTSMYIPIYATHWLEWISVQTETANGTAVEMRHLVLFFSDNRPEVDYYVEMLSVTIVPVPSLILTLGSVVLMIYGLNASSQMRNSMTAKATADDGATQESKMAHKTRRLMKMVLLIAILCIVCSAPRFFATTINTINSDISEVGKERNTYIFLWQLSRFATALNASLNIFVYLKINSNYQSTFRELFSLKCKLCIKKRS